MAEALQPPPQVAWKPHPGPQTAAICCPVEDLGYGGQRGGGKSGFLLGHNALRANDLGDAYRGLLVRRTYDELDELMEEAGKLYPKLGARWEAQHKTWRFPRGGFLRMRYLETTADAEHYQGHGYSDVGVDEAGNYPDPAPIDLLRGAMRTTGDVTCLMRLTFNPGGAGHDWLKERYVLRAPPMTPFKVQLDESSDTITRVFIPARLSDNPSITNPDAYRARIRASGPKWLVKAWLEGDWSGRPQGGLFHPDDLMLEPEDPQLLVRKLGLRPVCYWDFAATEKQRMSDDPDYSACVVVARDELGRWWILDAWRGQVDAVSVARQIIAMQRKWTCRVKGEKGALEKMIQPVLRLLCQEMDYHVHMEPISKGPIDKVAHSMALQMIMGSRNVYAPASAPWVKDLKHEFSTFPTLGRGIHDDWIDALSYAAQDLQRTQVGAVPMLGKKFHPEVTHDVLEKFEERRRALEKEDADDFW